MFTVIIRSRKGQWRWAVEIHGLRYPRQTLFDIQPQQHASTQSKRLPVRLPARSKRRKLASRAATEQSANGRRFRRWRATVAFVGGKPKVPSEPPHRIGIETFAFTWCFSGETVSFKFFFEKSIMVFLVTTTTRTVQITIQSVNVARCSMPR